MSALANQYQSTVDQLNALREQRLAARDAGNREAEAEFVRKIADAKDVMCRAHDAAIAEWQGSLGPIQASIDAKGKITLRQQSSLSGGKVSYLSPGDVAYSIWLAKIERDKGIDTQVAEVAYAAWAWRGPVAIDYYGVFANVRRPDGQKLKVDTRTMEVVANAQS